MPCPVWLRLVEVCLGATRKYNDCLEAARGLEKPAFNRALERVEEARTELQEAEAALQAHEAEHGCWGRPENSRKQSA
jgi:hypothetical protein